VSAALHDEDPEFSKFSRKPEMEKVARELIGFQNPLLIQSMYIFKQPRIGGEGNTHTAHGTRHTAHGTRHTAHGTRHTTHGTRHTCTEG
jgi:hypothetical protein